MQDISWKNFQIQGPALLALQKAIEVFLVTEFTSMIPKFVERKYS